MEQCSAAAVLGNTLHSAAERAFCCSRDNICCSAALCSGEILRVGRFNRWLLLLPGFRIPELNWSLQRHCCHTALHQTTATTVLYCTGSLTTALHCTASLTTVLHRIKPQSPLHCTSLWITHHCSALLQTTQLNCRPPECNHKVQSAVSQCKVALQCSGSQKEAQKSFSHFSLSTEAIYLSLL